MNKHSIVRLALGMALVGCSVAWAAGPSSANYAIPSSTLNSGVGDMSSASYKLSSSLGDLAYGTTLGSAGYQLGAGFWYTVVGVLPGCLLDIDGNGKVDALTDGLMILRALFGLTGTSVTAGAIGTGATRTTWAQIQPMINLSKLDIDGSGATEALTDGLMLMRAMFGLTGAAVTNGAVSASATRPTWTDIRGYLNASCGTSFGP